MHALISVSDKTGIVELARALADLGVTLLSTGGTAKLLSSAGLAVTEVAAHTGFPEMLDGRVKTLHPAIHGGLLARRDAPEHMAALEHHGIATIDLLIVNLYPFEATVAAPGCTLAEAIENIDIGGPAMVRSAAKNWSDVAVLTDAAQYAAVLAELKAGGAVSRETRFALAVAAFNRIACYDAAISDYLSSLSGPSEGAPERAEFAAQTNVQFVKLQDLRYGENPHQRAAFYRDLVPAPGSLVTARQLQGKELSYNNIADADAAWECVKSFGAPTLAAGAAALPPEGARPVLGRPGDRLGAPTLAAGAAALPPERAQPVLGRPGDRLDGAAACVIVKHANPCGVALGPSAADAYAKAFKTDPTSAFGGIIAFNVEVDRACAERIAQQFVEVLIAPSYSDEALAVFAAKANTRVLSIALPAGELKGNTHEMKRVGSGLLIQTADNQEIAANDLKVVTARQPSAAQMGDLLFAWKVAKFVKSNAIVFCAGGMTLGVGAGQMSRVDSARIASIKAEAAGLALAGSAVASDAFFPFRDGLDVVIDAGASSVIQPGGSMRDDEVVAAADERGIAMVFTGVRHFRH